MEISDMQKKLIEEIKKLPKRSLVYLQCFLKILNHVHIDGYKMLNCGFCKQNFFVESDTESTRICPYCANPVIIPSKEPIRKEVPLTRFEHE